MKVTLHQPNFFPRLKILQKLAAADLWVIMDGVQYCKQEWQNRTKIVPFSDGQNEFWLTMPVRCPNGSESLIKDVSIIPDKYIHKKWRLLEIAFHKAPYWKQFEQMMNRFYPYFNKTNLTQLNISITIELLKTTGKVPQILYSSSLPVTGRKSRLVAAICEYVNADVYLCDSGGYRYLDLSEFSNTKVIWQKWQEPVSVWKNIGSWRDISSINYFVREGEAKFADHLLNGQFFEDPSFYGEHNR